MLSPNALADCLADIDYYCGRGWDRPPRLFALVRTADLVVAIPWMAEHLGGPGTLEGRLSGIEQDGFEVDPGLDRLADLAWSDEVAGCGLAIERAVLPAGLAAGVPSGRPGREEARLVAGALRDGQALCLARLRRRPDQVLSGPGLAPGLVEALAATLV
jgi:hypothetical protein